jgi:ferredoxin
VFAQSRPVGSKLIATARAVGADPLDLRCPQHTSRTTTVAHAAIVQHPQCLAELSPSLLIELAQDRAVWLNDEKCADCPLKEAQTSIVRAVNEANRWRAAFDQPRQVHLMTVDLKVSSPPRPAPVLDSSNPPTDRRAFISLFKRTLAEAGAAAVSEEPGDDHQPAPVSHRLPQRFPCERQNLLTVLSRLSQPQDVPLGMANVSIEFEKCTACGLCAKFCPTGAIRFQADEHRFDLDFIPAACLDCGICVRACPTQAITLTHDTPPGRFIRLTATLLAEADLVPCTVCQKPTADHGEGTRCEVCRTVPDKHSLAKDLFSSLYRSQPISN